jgi:hypothetical protein
VPGDCVLRAGFFILLHGRLAHARVVAGPGRRHPQQRHEGVDLADATGAATTARA